MKIKAVICLIIGFILLSSCASEAEKKEKRKNKIIESIKKDNGTVLFDDKNSLYYTTNEGLFAINYDKSKSEPTQFYTNLDSLNIREYTMMLTPTKVDIQTIRQNFKDYNDSNLTKSEIISLFNSTNKSQLFKIEYPWILIGRDFIATLSDPYNVIKVSNLSDRGIGFKTETTVSNVKSKKVGGISIDRKLNLTDSLYHSDVIISLYNDSLKIQDMPGYLQYTTTMIPQEAWNGIWTYSELIPEFKEYNIGTNEEILNELSYKYNDYGVPTWSIKLNEDNSETTDNRILWGDLDYSITSWNKDDISSLFVQREKQINRGIENIKSKAQSKLRTAREKREKGLEEQRKRDEEARIAREEQRQREEQEYYATVERSAINVNDLMKQFIGNFEKASKTYHRGQKLLLTGHVEKITRGNSQYKYKLIVDDLMETEIIYSNDSRFADLYYPRTVWFEAYLNNFEKTDPWADFYELSFYDAKLIMWER